MPISWKWMDTYVRFELSGSFSQEELLIFAREVYESPDIPRGSDFLVDYRESDEVATGQQIRERVSVFRELVGEAPRRVALLVEKTVHFGLGRMASFQVGDSPVEIEVFTSETEALDWLTQAREGADGS